MTVYRQVFHEPGQVSRRMDDVGHLDDCADDVLRA
jgi:hypothetical protein